MFTTQRISWSWRWGIRFNSVLLFLGWLVAWLSAQAGPVLQFGPPAIYTVGNGARAVAVEDINHDGRLDLVTANFSASSVSVLLGLGDGTFTNLTNYAVGLSPSAVCVGDIDGDRHPDVATANYNDDTVSVLLGRGDGRFSAATNINVGDRPSAIVLGDFDRNGHLDLAVPNTLDSTVSVLSGNGDGTFGPRATNSMAGGSLHSLLASDFNGDERLDLVVASDNSDSGKVAVLLGNGDGTFGVASNYPVTYFFPPARNLSHVAVGDFNGDGRPDLVTANYVAASATFLRGQGDGTFVVLATNAVGNSPWNIAAADFDGDGNLDFVTANSGVNNLSVRTGNGDGTFMETAYFSAGAAPLFAAAGDFNGDGKPDVVTASQFGGTIGVLLNESPPQLQIGRLGTGIRISWPGWAGYELESNTNLSLATGWRPMSEASIVTGGRNTVTNSIGPDARFYRLKKL